MTTRAPDNERDRDGIKCPACNGNGTDRPCAYPGENKHGCLHDEPNLNLITLEIAHIRNSTSSKEIRERLDLIENAVKWWASSHNMGWQAAAEAYDAGVEAEQDKREAALTEATQDWRTEAWERHQRIIKKYGTVSLTAGSPEDQRFLALALAGEVGELANIIKKVWRGDFTLASKHKEIAAELADIAIYTTILAKALNVDLEAACMDKTLELRRRWAEDR